MDTQIIAKVVLFVSAGMIAYVYIGYPLIVFVLGRIFPRRIKKARFEPSVSFIITAFNEELSIAAKIENTLALEYPKEKLEIIVASDCSTDATESIVGGFADRGVRLVRNQDRLGKTAAQNLAVCAAKGEILHFSDATSIYRPDALGKIVANFADETVGCVSGRLFYTDPADTGVGSGAKTYWDYETFLKECESRACSLIGVSGCIYAVRRTNYVEMYPEACSDFLIATLIYKQGLRTVFEPAAVCREETNRASGNEMRMRVRVIAQTFTDLWRNREMLNPLRSGFFGVQLLSHKLLRYSVPIFLAAAFASSAFLSFRQPVFFGLFVAQVVFYAAAAAGWGLERAGLRIGPFAIPFYFLLANVASVAGFFQFVRGVRYAAWKPIRDSG